MTTTYRIDYTTDADGDTLVMQAFGTDRAAAMTAARYQSSKHGTAYAIATRDGQDTGQRVYHNGYFSHADDQF